MLGICVIYLVPNQESEILLQLSLEKLRIFTVCNHRIYGYALRLPKKYMDILRNAGITFPPIYLSELDLSLDYTEHSYLLDCLVDSAFADGCTHVATFDMDSWPIVSGWHNIYQERLTPEAPVAAIVRSELQDNFPFAAFIMMHHSFWKIGESSFNTILRARFEPHILAGIKRAKNTGAGIFAQLVRDDLQFFPLYRSNAWNPHSVMCGIYGYLVFHLGAGSRTPGFITDNDEFALNGNRIRSQLRDAVNSARRNFMLRALESQEYEFIEQLTGKQPRQFDPVPVSARSLLIKN